MSQPRRDPQAFRTALPAVIFVTAIFFFNFISRVVMAPLMPVIQADLGFTHSGAGHLFLGLATGNALGLLLAGFVSRSLRHGRTVGFSAVSIGICALIATQATSYLTLLACMFLLGTAVGLYLPSGIATLTSLVRKEDWGKTMAVHELAPNLSYVIAPILAEGVLLFFDWRTALLILGVSQILIGIWFFKAGQGGDFPGTVPNPAMVGQIVKKPFFWMLVLMFSMAVGASIGPYSMLPLYLVDAHGYTRENANQLLAVSRIMACFTPMLAGWLTDRWGPKPIIFLYFILTGTSLAALGLTSGSTLVTMVILQPVFSVILFVPGFTMLSMVFDPVYRTVAVALMGPLNALIGLGLIPTFLGHMGDAGMFNTGFLIQGCLMLVAMLFLSKLPSGRPE